MSLEGEGIEGREGIKCCIAYAEVSNCRCLGVLYKDTNSSDDEYINLDIRVMGQTVLLGWIQLL